MAHAREAELRRYGFVVAGGGLSGVCAAIAAARHGLKTALVHNRPVLGGNASSEVRMHVCGAAGVYCTRPNARETGIIEELLLENKRRNPYHSFSILDTVLWEKTRFQENLDLYLNCHIDGLEMEGGRICSVRAVQLTTEKAYLFEAPLFADTTGDAFLAHLVGARTFTGTEGRGVFGEPHAPGESGPQTMGSSLLFTAVDRGEPVPFTAPPWAHRFTEEALSGRVHSDVSSGYWWIELGGLQDTTADYEDIRDELLRVLYGVWDHIKNGGDHGAERYALDWVQFLPGKRESRRVLGDYVLVEQDLLEGRRFEDAVAYGGWPIDVHPSPGILGGALSAANRFIDLEDVYTIPYRCLYAADVENLMVGGRAISASHLAFASTRVMGTTAVIGQAIGTAAALQRRYDLTPRELYQKGHIPELQQTLLRDDCYLPGMANRDEADLARRATVRASSHLAGHPPENLLSGVARPEGTESNLWRAAPGEKTPFVELSWHEPVDVREAILRFDSDLCHDLTISIDRGVIDGWRNVPPPGLVRSYRVELFLAGALADTRTVEESCIRCAAVRYAAPVRADRLRLTLLSTYGPEGYGMFEIRVYG